MEAPGEQGQERHSYLECRLDYILYDQFPFLRVPLPHFGQPCQSMGQSGSWESRCVCWRETEAATGLVSNVRTVECRMRTYEIELHGKSKHSRNCDKIKGCASGPQTNSEVSKMQGRRINCNQDL